MSKLVGMFEFGKLEGSMLLSCRLWRENADGDECILLKFFGGVRAGSSYALCDCSCGRCG